MDFQQWWENYGNAKDEGIDECLRAWHDQQEKIDMLEESLMLTCNAAEILANYCLNGQVDQDIHQCMAQLEKADALYRKFKRD